VAGTWGSENCPDGWDGPPKADFPESYALFANKHTSIPKDLHFSTQRRSSPHVGPEKGSAQQISTQLLVM
jgi:hypothetical protein